MTAPACGSCGSATGDGAQLCTDCTRDLAEQLLLAASIAPDLDDAVARLLKRGSGGPRSETETPLPVDLAASDIRRDLQDELYRWCRVLRAPSWSWGTLPDMTHWLVRHLGDVRQHPRAAEMLDGIREDVSRALAVIDRPAERAPAGQCQACGAQLLAELGADTVTCNCGQVKINLLADRMNRAAAADVLGSAAAISDALKAIGIIVPRGTITSWASRQRLLPRPGGSYALSDVLALHAQSQARVRG